MRVLTVLADVPYPRMGGARTRNAYLLQALATHHDVVAVALDWGGQVGPVPDGIELITVPWELPPEHRALEEGDASAWERLTGDSALPLVVSYCASAPLGEVVRDVCAAWSPAVAVLTETSAVQFRTALPPTLPFVVDLHDVQSVKQLSRVDAGELARLLAFEQAAVADAALTVCVSSSEAARARDLLKARNVEVVPNGVDTDYFAPAPTVGDPDRLVFIGSLHTPENVEGIDWFVHDVLPIVRAQRPSVVLDIVGSKPTASVRRLESESVRLHADVADVRPYLYEAGVVVVPLLHGGGTRLKILEAAACERSVVTTAVGVEGLSLRDGHEVDVADDAEAFARAVLCLSRDDELRRHRGELARAGAAHYDWRVIGRDWRAVVESVGLAQARPQ